MTNKQDPCGFYETLGITPSATAAEIRSAYRAWAKVLHPDVNSAPGTAARFRAVQEAYDVLGDRGWRASYDASTYKESTSQHTAGDARGSSESGAGARSHRLRLHSLPQDHCPAAPYRLPWVLESPMLRLN
jgi:DnaJ-class molecular chaperone